MRLRGDPLGQPGHSGDLLQAGLHHRVHVERCHWSGPEFDDIVKKIDTEMDKAKRIELYRKSQEIFIDRAPAINIFVQKTAAAAGSRVENLKLGYAWITPRFWEASFK